MLPFVGYDDHTDQTKKIIILKLKINLVLNVSLTTYLFCPTGKVPWGPFLESPGNFSGPKTFFSVCRVSIQGPNFNNFENNRMKLKVSEAKLTGCVLGTVRAVIQVLILTFAFGPKKVTGPLMETKDSNEIRIITNHFISFRELIVKNFIWKTFKTSILNNNNSLTDPSVVGTCDREKCPLTDICTPRFC